MRGGRPSSEGAKRTRRTFLPLSTHRNAEQIPRSTSSAAIHEEDNDKQHKKEKEKRKPKKTGSDHIMNQLV